MKIKLLLIGFVIALFTNVVNAEMARVDNRRSVMAEEKLEVIFVDHEKRWVRLKDINGYAKKIDVTDEVKNFDQVKVGDIVTLMYANSIHVRAYAADMVEDQDVVEAVYGKAAAGEKPGKFMASKMVLVATIETIDMDNNTVTLKGAEGNTEVFPVRYPDNLKQVKVGDKVIITYTNAVAITVTGQSAAE